MLREREIEGCLVCARTEQRRRWSRKRTRLQEFAVLCSEGCLCLASYCHTFRVVGNSEECESACRMRECRMVAARCQFVSAAPSLVARECVCGVSACGD